MHAGSGHLAKLCLCYLIGAPKKNEQKHAAVEFVVEVRRVGKPDSCLGIRATGDGRVLRCGALTTSDVMFISRNFDNTSGTFGPVGSCTLVAHSDMVGPDLGHGLW